MSAGGGASGGAATSGEREDFFFFFKIQIRRIRIKSIYFLDSEEFKFEFGALEEGHDLRSRRKQIPTSGCVGDGCGGEREIRGGRG